MRTLLCALLLAPAVALAHPSTSARGAGNEAAGQDATEARRMFEAGRYQQVVNTAGDEAAPAVIYIAAQSHQKLGATEEARAAYERLAARGEDDPWHFIGLSGQQLLADEAATALESAQRAVALGPKLPDAHYQLGLVQAKRADWRSAAEAFDRASELSPGLAYAHYYGGLMHYRAGRPDRMAIHFEQFLKLAPEAPERPEVLQIMKTVRGR